MLTLETDAVAPQGPLQCWRLAILMTATQRKLPRASCSVTHSRGSSSIHQEASDLPMGHNQRTGHQYSLLSNSSAALTSHSPQAKPLTTSLTCGLRHLQLGQIEGGGMNSKSRGRPASCTCDISFPKHSADGHRAALVPVKPTPLQLLV